MLGHYLRHGLHIAENLKQEVGCFPATWSVAENPDWVSIALEDSQNLRNEIEQIQDLASDVRKMVGISKLPLLFTAYSFTDRKFP